MNKFKTENYYRELNKDSLCSCDYCRNYYKEVKAAYSELSDHLAGMGVDIEKPFETIPLEPYEGNIEYIAVQYIVIGNAADFKSENVYGVHIGIADALHLELVGGGRREVLEVDGVVLNIGHVDPLASGSAHTIDTEVVDDQVVHIIIHVVDGDVALLTGIFAQVDADLIPYTLAFAHSHFAQHGGLRKVGEGVAVEREKHLVGI